MGGTMTESTAKRLLQPADAAGPVPRDEGGDPAYFTGYLGGG